MDLAYVYKLANNNNGMKHLLVGQDLFDRIVDAKRMKTKYSKETVRAFLTMNTKNNPTKELWIDKRTELPGEYKNLCRTDGIQFYCTTSEIKASFAERTLRSSKSILYPYTEDYGYKYIHPLTLFVTILTLRRNCSIDLITKNVKKSEFLSIVYAYHYDLLENPNLKIRQNSHLEVWLTLQQGLCATI